MHLSIRGELISMTTYNMMMPFSKLFINLVTRSLVANTNPLLLCKVLTDLSHTKKKLGFVFAYADQVVRLGKSNYNPNEKRTC